MISKKMQEAINVQINNEMWSAYLYLSMSLTMSNVGLKGFAHWFRKQSEEEMQHAFRFIEYLEKQFAKIDLRPIAQLPTCGDLPIDVFNSALENERKVTAQINRLYRLAIEEDDYASNCFLQWFINEQVEEEESVQSIIDNLSLIGSDKASLFILDNKLSKR